MRKTLLQLSLSLGISIACMVWLLRKIDLSNLLEIVLTVNPLYYAAGCALISMLFYVRALRWSILLSSCGSCGLGGLYSSNLIGYMANNLLPFRMGELVRAYSASQLVRVPLSSALASIVLERVFDGLGLCLCIFLTIIFLDPGQSSRYVSAEVMTASAAGLLLIFLTLLAGLACLTIWPHKVSTFLSGLAAKASPRLAERLERALSDFSLGLVALRRVNALPAIVFYTLATWFVAFLLHLIFLPPLGLPLSPLLAGLALVGGNLALTIPAAPGYIGTMQMGTVAALSLAGVQQELAIDYAMIGWAVVYFPIVAAGLVEMWRRGMSLGGLKRRADEISG